MKLVRRVCTDVRQSCQTSPMCPDLWETDTGDFVAIGKDVTQEVLENLPKGVSVGNDEKIIVLPRKLVLSTKANIPDE